MPKTAETKAVSRPRKPVKESGLTRFQVVGRKSDRELIRSLARQLAENGPEAARIRQAVSVESTDPKSSVGGIYRWLRNSPLVGFDLKIHRSPDDDRTIEL